MGKFLYQERSNYQCKFYNFLDAYQINTPRDGQKLQILTDFETDGFNKPERFFCAEKIQINGHIP